MTHLRTPPSPSPSSREDAGTYAGTYARTYAGIVVLHLAPGGCRRVMLWVAGSLRAASLVVTANVVQHEAVGVACAGEVVPCSQLSAAAPHLCRRLHCGVRRALLVVPCCSGPLSYRHKVTVFAVLYAVYAVYYFMR
jgi:hypothetical protein